MFTSNSINALNYDFDLDEFLSNVVLLDNYSFPSTASPSDSVESRNINSNSNFQGPTFGNTTSMQQQQQQLSIMPQRQQLEQQQKHQNKYFQQSKEVNNVGNQLAYQQQEQSQHIQKHPRLYEQHQTQQKSSDFNALPLSSSFSFPNTNISSENQSNSSQLSLHQQIQQQYFQHHQAKQQQATSNAQQVQSQTGVLMSEPKNQLHHTSSTNTSSNANLTVNTGTTTTTSTNTIDNSNVKKTLLMKKRNSEDFDDVDDDDGDDADSDNDKKKSPWTLDEDIKLVQLFNEFGSSWSRISNVMQTRNKIDIKNRFRSIIRARNRIWTPEEDEKLLQLHEEMGSNWQIIQSHFSNRTRHALRVRYKYLRDNKPSETTGKDAPQHSPPELLVPGSPYQVLIYCRENVTYSPLLTTINKCAKASPKPPLKNKLESPAPSTFVPKRSSSLAASTPKQTTLPISTPISSAIGKNSTPGMPSTASTPATTTIVPTYYNNGNEYARGNNAYIKFEKDDSMFGTFDFPPIEAGLDEASGFASYEESVLDSRYML